VTGGTGSLGSHLIDFLLKVPGESHHFVVFSRDEQKQYKMSLKYPDNKNISFVLGDVRDQQSVMDAVAQYRPDIVVHTAAQKHVKICEHNPMQTVLTNIHGTKHVVRACLANNVKVACFVSTDKAVMPTTLYGMTKNIAEQIWVNAAKKGSTRFVGVRYGNILNSAGSLIPLYLDLMKVDHPVFPVTDEKMTRFFITFNQAIGLIMKAIVDENNSHLLGNFEIRSPEIYTIDRNIFRVPKLPAIKIIDIANIFAEHSNGTVKIIGAFESEKLNESMVLGYNSSDGSFATPEMVKTLLIEEGLLLPKE
jgi:UDP-N-acetylglucosamine 4,6-dehydratase